MVASPLYLTKPDPPRVLLRRADVRNFPFNATRALLEAAGVAVPPSALPSARYLGPERLFVRTIRTTVAREESVLTVNATLLRNSASEADVALHWREMGATPGPWQVVAGAKPPQGRGVFVHTIPIPSEDFEWYVSSGDLVFPPGWADENETVTVVVV